MLEDPFVCGVGFTGEIGGGVGPYRLGYELRPVGGGELIDLGEFTVASEGPYASPAGFIAPLASENRDFLVSVVLTDSGGARLSLPDLFVAEVRAECGPVEGSVSQAQAIEYPGPFTNAPGGGSGTFELPDTTAASADSDGPGTPPLATTGTNTPLLATLSLVLLTLGGMFVVAARRENNLD